MLHLSRNLDLPLSVAMETITILGRKGTGKTYTMLKMAEEMIKADVPVVIIDEVGVCWGLRSNAAGDGPGLDVLIAGGDSGDLPLSEQDGRMLAEFVVGNPISMILDLSHLSGAAGRRFVAAFTNGLYEIKGQRKNRSPIHLMVDEADQFAPQTVRGDTAKSMGALDRVVRRGRARGIGITLASQRPATLHKDLLTQSTILVCHQLTSPQDRKAALEWVKANGTQEQISEFQSSIPLMDRGRAWWWSPGEYDLFKEVRVNKRETFDSSATPEVGMSGEKLVTMAEIDIDALKGKLETMVEKAKATDPKLLKQRVAELERDLAKAQAQDVDSEDLRMMRSLHQKILKEASSINAQLKGATDEIQSIGARLVEMSLPTLNFDDAPPVLPNGIKTEVSPRLRSSPAQLKASSLPSPSAAARITSGLGKCSRSILKCLAQTGQPTSRKKIGVMAMYSYTSGGFSNAIGDLRNYDDGPLIEDCADKSIAITEIGLSVVGDFDALPVGVELVQWWQRHKRIGKCEREILDVLLEAYPEHLGREELAARTLTQYSFSSGGFSNALGKLRTIGLLQPGKTFALSPEVF